LLEHLTTKQFEDYLGRRLSASELLAVSDHLGSCAACRGQLDNGDAPFLAVHAEIFSDDAALVHLTEDQTADYVDKALAQEQLQVVQDHLVRCEACTIAVDDLRSFRNEIAPSLDRDLGPSVMATPAKVSQRRSWFQRFPIPALGAAFGILLLAVAGWIIWRSISRTEPQREIVELPKATPIPTPPVESASPTPEIPNIAVQLKDGNRVLALDQQGNLTGAEDLPASYQNLVKRALQGQRVGRSSQLEGLSRGPSNLMGPEAPKSEFHVVGPIGVVSLNNRPALHWTKLEGATSYVVEVYDEAFKLVAASESLTATTWTPPALARGHVYSWQVKATKDGQETTSPKPPAPQAKFRVLDQRRADEIARAGRAHGTSHLALGLLYADAGLLNDAEREFRIVLRANPNSDLARNLLRQVRSLR
jgi:hypothetical protein